MSQFRPFLSPERIRRHEAAGEWPAPGPSALLSARAAETPERLFLIDGATRLTFAEFERRTARLATGLARLGVGPGDVVSWQLPSWWEAAALAVAIDWIGAVSNPIIPICRAREVAFVTAQAGASVLVVPGRFRTFDHRELAAAVRRATPSLTSVVVARDTPGSGMTAFADLLAPGPVPPRAAAAPHEIATVFYTSGTTAEPKGVLHTRSTLGAFARLNAALSGAGPGDVSLLQFPLTHIGGLGAFLLLPLLTGSRAVYLDLWEPERALALIEREGVTSAGGPPPILQGLLGAPGFRPARVRSVRLAGSGAADVPPDLIRTVRRQFGAASFRAYGLTECPMLTSGRLDDPEEACATTDGRPAPGCQVRIVDDAGRGLPPDHEGEIEAYGPQLCVGYVDERLNTAAFTADGWLRTGDRGVVDAAGFLRVTGRRKDIIIRKGENLSAQAIEDVLAEHPAVAEVAVVGLPDTATGERACACVVLRPGASLSLAEVRAFMEGRGIMRQKIPEQLETVSTLPRNATGKVLKFELRRQLRDG
jgi:cyclohexanecarboxylate-CoA ligase